MCNVILSAILANASIAESQDGNYQEIEWI